MNTNPEYAPTPGPQDPEQLALAFRGLGKHFGQKIAVNNLTLEHPAWNDVWSRWSKWRWKNHRLIDGDRYFTSQFW